MTKEGEGGQANADNPLIAKVIVLVKNCVRYRLYVMSSRSKENLESNGGYEKLNDLENFENNPRKTLSLVSPTDLLNVQNFTPIR